MNIRALKMKNIVGIRNYRLCSPPRPPGECGCNPQVPSYQTIMPPPSTCRVTDIPPNPCAPRYHYGKGTWRRYKYMVFFIGFPLILIQTLHAFGHKSPMKESCRDYDFMRKRIRRYPWGDGRATLFHNDRVNHLPGECEPPPLDCD